MSITTMLEITASLWRPSTTTRDANKGSALDFGTEPIVADFPCSIQSSSPSIMQAFAQNQTRVNTTIYTATNIDAQVNDKIIAVDPESESTRTFLVVGNSDTVTGRRVLGSSLWQAQCWEQT